MSTRIDDVVAGRTDGGRVEIHGDCWSLGHPIMLLCQAKNSEGEMIDLARVHFTPRQAEELGAALLALGRIEARRQR